MNAEEKILLRFESKYIPEPNSGCWLWTGNCYPNGYGQISINYKSCLAHRYSWTVKYGAIPDGLWVLHRCDVKKCVNPDHLFLGTNSDNQKDAIAKGIKIGLHYGHQRKREMTHCKRGHEFTFDNTRLSKRGERHCRTCHAEQERARRREQRECAMDLA